MQTARLADGIVSAFLNRSIPTRRGMSSALQAFGRISQPGTVDGA